MTFLRLARLTLYFDGRPLDNTRRVQIELPFSIESFRRSTTADARDITGYIHYFDTRVFFFLRMFTRWNLIHSSSNWLPCRHRCRPRYAQFTPPARHDESVLSVSSQAV